MIDKQKQLELAKKLQRSSPEKAVKILDALDNRGDMVATCLLGHAYETGLGVSKNFSIAFAKYSKAAKAGNLNAILQLAVWYREGRGGVLKDEPEMLKYLEIASAKNDPRAWFELGCYFQDLETGSGEDPVEAFRCFEKSAELGHIKSQVWLAEALLDGYGCKKDQEEGIHILRRSVEAGNPHSKYVMADLLVRNILPRDFEMAFRLAHEAAKCGDPDAEFMVGWMLLKGVGVKQDNGGAMNFLDRAMANGHFKAEQLLEQNKGLRTVKLNSKDKPETGNRDSDGLRKGQ